MDKSSDLDIQTTNVVGVFDSIDKAEAAVGALRSANVELDEVSIVGQAPGEAPQIGSHDTHANTGTVTGAAVGAAVGGLLGLVSLAVPGLGFVVAAGALATTLAGAGTGGAAGALIGSFAGLGVPTEHGRRYEEAVRAGGVVLTIQVRDGDLAERARAVLDQAGARETAAYQTVL